MPSRESRSSGLLHLHPRGFASLFMRRRPWVRISKEGRKGGRAGWGRRTVSHFPSLGYKYHNNSSTIGPSQVHNGLEWVVSLIKRAWKSGRRCAIGKTYHWQRDTTSIWGPIGCPIAMSFRMDWLPKRQKTDQIWVTPSVWGTKNSSEMLVYLQKW